MGLVQAEACNWQQASLSSATPYVGYARRCP